MGDKHLLFVLDDFVCQLIDVLATEFLLHFFVIMHL